MFGIPGGLEWLWSGSKSAVFWGCDMDFPSCPVCGTGRLLPLSDENEPFALWICSAPNCAYSVSKDATGDTYYKGQAAAAEKEKNGKRWTEYEF